MKTLVVGQLPVIEEAASALYAEHGTEVGRLGNLREVLAQPSLEPIAVLAPLSSADDVTLLPALVTRKVKLLLIADVVSLELRARALEHGAIDVIFPPVTASQVLAVLGSLRGEPPPRIARHRAGFPASLQGRETESVEARVVSLSSAGFDAELGHAGVNEGAVLRVTLQPPAPHRPLHLHGRVLATAGMPTGGLRFAVRFLGLTSEESAALVDLVDTLPPWPEALAQVLETFDGLDVAVLRQVAVGQATPVRLPAFTALEEEALAAGWGTDTSEDSGVADAAVARVRAALLTDVLEKEPAMPGEPRIAHALQSLQRAQEKMRAVAKAAPEDRLPMVRDLQKRLASAAERIQQLAGMSAPPAPPQLKAVAPSPIERFLEKLPPSPARWAILAGVPAVALILLCVLVKLFFPGDPARSTVAENPQITVLGIRVVEVTKEGDLGLAVVDGSWFGATEESRERVARIAAASIDGETSLEVRDLRGRPLATVRGQEVTLFPLPGPRDTPPPRS